MCAVKEIKIGDPACVISVTYKVAEHFGVPLRDPLLFFLSFRLVHPVLVIPMVVSVFLYKQTDSICTKQNNNELDVADRARPHAAASVSDAKMWGDTDGGV